MAVLKIDNLRFEFQVGECEFALDPWQVWVDLLSGGVFGLLEDSQAEALSEEKRVNATKALCDLGRQVFEMPEAITDATCLSIVMAYFEFCDECKKKENSWLELLPLTDQASLQAKAVASVQEQSSS